MPKKKTIVKTAEITSKLKPYFEALIGEVKDIQSEPEHEKVITHLKHCIALLDSIETK